MQGRVAQEREKFESLAHEMELKEQECFVKDEKLRQVRELIRNSPLSAVRSNPNTPFKERHVHKDNKTKPGVRETLEINELHISYILEIKNIA